MVKPIPYNQKLTLLSTDREKPVTVQFKPAGHILGSAFIEVFIGKGRQTKKVVFSGDLGAPYTPLLPAPKSPWSVDMIVLESTYGNQVYESKRQRWKELRYLIERCFSNRGAALIPAFSIGRTRELLYEIEQIFHRYCDDETALGIIWLDIDVIVDSPLAAKFTMVYKELKDCWDKEMR
jgi:metallo-beta-lactamase family protein